MMRFREFQQGDIEAIRARSGKEYDKLPDPKDFEDALTGVDGSGVPRIVMKAQKVAEIYMILDHGFETPAMRWAVVELAHEEMKKRLLEKGYDVAYSFFADGVPNSYIRRLVKLGWSRVIDRCARFSRGGRDISGHAGIGGDLLGNSSTATGLSNLYNSQASAVNSTLAPALTAEAVNPTGYTPTQMGAQTTAAEQSAGGANAGASGGALLRAARTRNAGAAPAAIDSANQHASEGLSQINAGIQTKNADLQQKQKQQGLSGLEGLYGENVGAGENALSESNTSLNDAGNLSNFWQQYLLSAMSGASKAATAGMG